MNKGNGHYVVLHKEVVLRLRCAFVGYKTCQNTEMYRLISFSAILEGASVKAMVGE